MRLYTPAVLTALMLGLAACDPRAADSPGAATPPAEAPAPAPAVAPPPAAAASTFDGNFKLVGTEPFWGVNINGGQMVLDRPDQAAVVAPRPAPAMEDQSAVWTSGALIVRLTPGDCSDGMSDRSYAYTATVKVGGLTLSGCGDRPEALAAQPG